MHNVSGPPESRATVTRALNGAVLLTGLLAGLVSAQQDGGAVGDLNNLVRASLRTDKSIVQAGRPVWVDFVVTNQTENRITMRVPQGSVDPTEVSEMGLPLEHVFSGRGFTGPMLEDENGERHDSGTAVEPRQKAPAIKLAPFGGVGRRVELSRYYPALLRAGKYKLAWRPYNGSISSDPLSITVLAEQQVSILTDLGKMTMRFYYEQAPNHVQNFIELVEQRFYDNLTFNRVIPGGLIQGGDPLGNRRGVRPDGKRLKAEFNEIPFEFGTVGMARSSQDPDSASCQFFICLGRQPAFDGQQTAFGYLVGDESLETLRRIAAVPTNVHNGLSDYPRRPVYIRAISLETVPSRHRRNTPISPPTPESQPSISISRDSGPSLPALSASQREAAPGFKARSNVGRQAAASRPGD